MKRAGILGVVMAFCVAGGMQARAQQAAAGEPAEAAPAQAGRRRRLLRSAASEEPHRGRTRRRGHALGAAPVQHEDHRHRARGPRRTHGRSAAHALLLPVRGDELPRGIRAERSAPGAAAGGGAGEDVRHRRAERHPSGGLRRVAGARRRVRLVRPGHARATARLRPRRLRGARSAACRRRRISPMRWPGPAPTARVYWASTRSSTTPWPHSRSRSPQRRTMLRCGRSAPRSSGRWASASCWEGLQGTNPCARS